MNKLGSSKRVIYGKNNISAYLISKAPPLNYYGLYNETVQPNKLIIGVYEYSWNKSGGIHDDPRYIMKLHNHNLWTSHS